MYLSVAMMLPVTVHSDIIYSVTVNIGQFVYVPWVILSLRILRRQGISIYLALYTVNEKHYRIIIKTCIPLQRNA